MPAPDAATGAVREAVAVELLVSGVLSVLMVGLGGPAVNPSAVPGRTWPHVAIGLACERVSGSDQLAALGLVVNPLNAALVGAFGWALGGLLPAESDRPR